MPGAIEDVAIIEALLELPEFGCLSLLIDEVDELLRETMIKRSRAHIADLQHLI